MFGIGKRAREKVALQSAQRDLLQNALRARLHGLVDSVATDLLKNHKLSLEQISSIEEGADSIKTGIDIVLLEQVEAFDEKIPHKFRGGAIIANSAHAHFFAGIGLDDSKVFDLIGSEKDAQTVGHIRYNLGFERDGFKIRE